MFRPTKQYVLISKYTFISDMRLIMRKYGMSILTNTNVFHVISLTDHHTPTLHYCLYGVPLCLLLIEEGVRLPVVPLG